MKRGLLIGGGVLLIAVVAVVLLLVNLSSIVKTVVERVGSAATQAKVTLDRADVSVTSGKGSLHGLTVGNPAGFRTDSAMNLGEIGVDLDVSTVRSDVIVIREIVISAPRITYEFAAGGSNIETLRKNVQAYAGSEKARPAATREKTGPRLVIDNLYIRDGQINVSADFLKGQKAGVALPTIHLKDIGKKDGKNMGASAAEVAERVIAAIGSNATRAVGTLNIGAIQDALREGAGGAEKALKEGAEERLKKVLGR